jgi:hypothetical protein
MSTTSKKKSVSKEKRKSPNDSKSSKKQQKKLVVSSDSESEEEVELRMTNPMYVEVSLKMAARRLHSNLQEGNAPVDVFCNSRFPTSSHRIQKAVNDKLRWDPSRLWARP